MAKTYFNRKRQLKINELYEDVLKGKNIDSALPEIERIVYQDGENIIMAEMYENFTAREKEPPRYYDTKAITTLAMVLMIDFINKGKEDPNWIIPLKYDDAFKLLAQISGKGIDIEIILKPLIEKFIDGVKKAKTYDHYDSFVSVLNFLTIHLRIAKPKRQLDYVRIVYEKMKELEMKKAKGYTGKIIRKIKKYCKEELK